MSRPPIALTWLCYQRVQLLFGLSMCQAHVVCSKKEQCRFEEHQHAQKCERAHCRWANATNEEQVREAKHKRNAYYRDAPLSECFPYPTSSFQLEFIENPFSALCAMCNHLWFTWDLAAIGSMWDMQQWKVALVHFHQSRGRWASMRDMSWILA